MQEVCQLSGKLTHLQGPASPNLNTEFHLFEIWIQNPSLFDKWILEYCFEILNPRWFMTKNICPYLSDLMILLSQMEERERERVCVGIWLLYLMDNPYAASTDMTTEIQEWEIQLFWCVHSDKKVEPPRRDSICRLQRVSFVLSQ